MLEGTNPGVVVVVEFPDRGAAQAWYDSDAYQHILPLRVDNSRSRALQLDGVEPGHSATDVLATLYFGVMRSHPVIGMTLLLALLVAGIWTTPNRWGLAIALHYLSRVYWPQPADPIPPPAATDPGEAER